MLNELIERIKVHQKQKIDGKWHQKLVIHYNCVGYFEIPYILPLPEPDAAVHTRKGVNVSYTRRKKPGNMNRVSSEDT